MYIFTGVMVKLIQDVTAIVAERDSQIKSLEDKVKELKACQLLIVLLECHSNSLVHAKEECYRRIQCIIITGTSYST